MLTHHLILLIAGKERPLTIYADHCVITDTGQLEFYFTTETSDVLIGSVPTNIIIAHTES